MLNAQSKWNELKVNIDNVIQESVKDAFGSEQMIMEMNPEKLAGIQTIFNAKNTLYDFVESLLKQRQQDEELLHAILDAVKKEKK